MSIQDSAFEGCRKEDWVQPPGGFLDGVTAWASVRISAYKAFPYGIFNNCISQFTCYGFPTSFLYSVSFPLPPLSVCFRCFTLLYVNSSRWQSLKIHQRPQHCAGWAPLVTCSDSGRASFPTHGCLHQWSKMNTGLETSPGNISPQAHLLFWFRESNTACIAPPQIN